MLCALLSQDHVQVNLNNPRHKLIKVEKGESWFKWGQAYTNHPRNTHGPPGIVLGVEELALSEIQVIHTHLG